MQLANPTKNIVCFNVKVSGAEFSLSNLAPHYTSEQSHSRQLDYKPPLRPVLTFLLFVWLTWPAVSEAVWSAQESDAQMLL